MTLWLWFQRNLLGYLLIFALLVAVVAAIYWLFS